MTIKDIDSLILKCKHFRLSLSEMTGNSPEEVRAYADGYINCKDNLIKILEHMKTKTEGMAEPKKMLIEDCDLSVRSYNCLKRAGINTLGDIKSEEQLMQVRNLGKHSFQEVIDKLREYGIEFEETEETDET